MNPSMLQLLRCPFCGGTLRAGGRDRRQGGLEYTVLSCHCGRYPVVAGIPLLRKGVIGPARQTADQVIDLIEAGRGREALRLLLMPPAPTNDLLVPAWLRAWPSVRGLNRLKQLCAQPALRAWRQRAEAFLNRPPEQVAGSDLLTFALGPATRGRPDPYSYYTCCFGTPRYLVGLSLASLIQAQDQPILDLACGYGYFTRALLSRAAGQPVIGIDRDFFALYVAKGWMAPEADYVCADAEVSLPCADDTFSVAFCANAFQLFVHKASCIRELKRLTQPQGLILLAAVRNAFVKPHLYAQASHVALPPAGYAALVADMPHRLLGTTDLVTRYLEKHGPALADPCAPESLAEEQWLSVVASRQPEVFRDYGAFEDWPHAAGRLAVNPLYDQEGPDASGQVQLHLRMPSPWFEQEDGDCRRYLPETVSLKGEVGHDLARGQRTMEIERWLAQCVVVGLPERFR
jgi:ubiquinone/menaquinone biosynthesis C-methylase UbiE/uncharacterized protein YbaR (Trm112 family)